MGQICSIKKEMEEYYQEQQLKVLGEYKPSHISLYAQSFIFHPYS